ncbi:hypothetical protein BGZ83_008531 [Gryganskiella cystojenkinii]|nr:hypothetical protein BGZ83_008531 [Gryganskiella cystojenkinii]
MVGLKLALSLFCLFLISSPASLAAPTPVSIPSEQQEITDSTGDLFERSASTFNPRQKWQQDELNCIQIYNPAPGALYHPGWFVRMVYGTQECHGATAAGPWTIHLYNNPEIQQSGNIRFDYHEVIVDGLNEYKTQYIWNIPQDQDIKTRNVKKVNDYYVRIETNAQDGTKLVGNVGPFAISPETGGAMGGFKTLTDDLQELTRREEAFNDDFDAEFALRPKTVVVQQDPPHLVDSENGPRTPAATDQSEQAIRHPPKALPKKIFKNIPKAPEVPVPSVVSPVPPMVSLVPPMVSPVPPMVSPAPTNAPAETALPDFNSIPIPHNLPPDSPTPTIVVSEPGAPLPHNLPPTVDNDPKTPITPISHRSLIPNLWLVVAPIVAGGLGLGYYGGVTFGGVGAALGAVVGGVIGGLAVVFNAFGFPV